MSVVITFAQLNEPCLPDGIFFNSQAQIDNFQTDYPDCDAIGGYVIIYGDDITNFNGLNNLNSIGGDLSINGNTSLTTLTGFDNLDSIGGSFMIENNVSLTTLTDLGHKVFIGGDLQIFENQF